MIHVCPEKNADQNHNTSEMHNHVQTSDTVSCFDKSGSDDRESNEDESVASNEIVHEGDVSEVSEQVILEYAVDADMTEDQSIFKTLILKRKTKTKANRASKKATGAAVVDASEVDSESSNVEESVMDSDCESSDSVSSASQKRTDRSAYVLDKIKKFLQTMKGMKGVNVEDYLPDRELFIDSTRALMKEGGAFTEQEVFRLRKIVQKLKLNLLNNEFEPV